MPDALVETKFFVPHARESAVVRPRLDEPFTSRRRLTLVSAPAGFGKTTLVGSWLGTHASATGTRTAWLSLDRGDREPETFWTYVLTALDRATPGAGSAGLAALGAGQPVESALASVVNELSVLPDDLVLVLDDYHLADGPLVKLGMAFLLDRLPPQVQLVIITRADPALPLARLRARGELAEVRVADLRFTDDEISAFLAGATGLSLGPDDVAALGNRTEGWIASLQLAAISLRDRADPSGFIAGFAGDDRYVVDYLVEEVLSHEPDVVRDFLLRTSVLDRLTGPLCDAVTRGPEGRPGGGPGGGEMLESLERRNVFVVPLDDQRRWYRYHHLFADVLHARLMQEDPGVIPELHRRAGEWYAEAGNHEASVRHALAAGDGARAADLVELALPDLRRDRRESLLRGWARELPDDVVGDRPVLAVGLAGGLMASNDFGDVERRLQDVERMLTRPAADLVVLDARELERVPAAIETYRSGLALVGGDLSLAISHAHDAMRMAPVDDDLTGAAAAALAGLANWGMGDIEAAHQAYTTCVEGLIRADHVADVLGCSIALADMELALGRLRDAEGTLRHALDLADRRPDDGAPGSAGRLPLRGTSDMLVGLSRCAWHRDDLEGAAELLGRADELGEPLGLPQNPYRWRVALARLRVADHDYPGALELLDEAERVFVSDFSPPVHPIHATRARVLLAAGDVAAVVDWARRHKLAADDDLSYLREYEHLTLARVLLAQHQAGGATELLARASGLLERLRDAAEAGGRLGTVIEIDVLRAVACSLAGDEEAALAALGHAVDLAEPDGWIRYFVDAGPALSPLLQALSARRDASPVVARLLAANGAGTVARPLLTSPAGDQPGPPSVPQPVAPSMTGSLPDPLSDRELEVLRLLASDLDGPGIARHLVVSLNTVRSHTKHIYTKLDVNSRRSAVSRGHQLGLFSITRH
jgi:LuxR family transcriptional regulator, maltose regulon positive regulatory protein